MYIHNQHENTLDESNLVIFALTLKLKKKHFIFKFKYPPMCRKNTLQKIVMEKDEGKETEIIYYYKKKWSI